MTDHLSVETLSTYLDRELVGSEYRQVEAHLESCLQCREHLQSMQKVVGRLQAMDRLTPPPHLGFLIRRLASTAASRPTLVERMETEASRFTVQAAVAPFFAVVLALVVIIYMLSWGLHHQDTGRIPVHLEPEPVTLDSPRSSEVPPDDKADTEMSRSVADRLFDRSQGVWIERGLTDGLQVESMSVDDPAFELWCAAHPELQELSSLTGNVRFEIDGRVVEIDFSGR